MGLKLAERIGEKANLIPIDDLLPMKWLSLDPKSRPRIEDVLDLLANDVPIFQFHFMGCMSFDYRAKEVVRYRRNRFDAESKASHLVIAVSILEEDLRRDNSDLSAQKVLRYCHYFRIGVEKDEEKAISPSQRGCEPGYLDSMWFLGALYPLVIVMGMAKKEMGAER